MLLFAISHLGRGRPTPSRQRLALLAGRTVGTASRLLGRGGGTAMPGLVAGLVAPDLVEALGRASEHGAVLVTGTNGKTTTSHLLTAIAREAGLRVIANPSGSNLERGLVGALVDSAGHLGGLPELQGSVAILEVDEAAAAAAIPRIRPRAVVVLNLFRDQLDRYGEVDSIARGWWHALEAEGGGPTLVLNADDPSVAQLAEVARGDAVTFGVEDRGVALRAADHAADARFCLCGGTFEYAARFIGHVGHWRCTSCARGWAAPAVSARNVRLDDARARFDLVTPSGSSEVQLPLAGLYSVYNALAAAAAAYALGLPGEATLSALTEAGPAFGRQERFTVDGRDVRLLLAKNPAGLNEIIRTLAASRPDLHLLWLLNDGIQDGRDVSWIYDADIEVLAGRVRALTVGGDRASDLALRLHLGGLDASSTHPGIREALDVALESTAVGGQLEIVATYTAMLDVRSHLAARTGRDAYWEVRA